MTDRIKKLVELTVAGKLRPDPVKTDYDREDLFLSPVKMSSSRVCEFILNQEPVVLDESAMTGLLIFDGTVEGDLFHRAGHQFFHKAYQNFYNKPVDNLVTFEWQHFTGNFERIIRNGISGIKQDIRDSMEKHREDHAAIEFLETQLDICNAIIGWARKCALRAEEKAQTAEKAVYRSNLLRLAYSLRKVPEKPAESFFEAVLSLYLCHPFAPDSIGLIDRYLYPYYLADLEKGILTDEAATETLQELFLQLQARKQINSDRFYRGGESHFCVGGYLPNGEDGFTDFSRLIVDSVLDLPTWIPQISLRWTKKTPTEVLRYMMDCERKDPNKRIAFVNDEPRIRGLMEYSGFSYEDAVSYTMLGCNELSLPGGMVMGFDMTNIMRSLSNTFHQRTSDILKVKSFEAFYEIYEEELHKDLREVNRIGAGLQAIRSRDCNLVTNIFLDGCIETARSCTQGGCSRYMAMGVLIGISNVIDSLSVTKQFVFDEKRITMEQLVRALQDNWEGHEMLRKLILNQGKFFGNDDACSNEIAREFFRSINKWNDGQNYLGKKWVFGNLIGYNEHHKFFGEKLPATPDGRFAGDSVNFGLGQTGEKDRSGLTALLNSVAKCDPECLLTGPSVTNVHLDKRLIDDDVSFEKLVYLFEAYFQKGGTHFQLTDVSREDWLEAKVEPEKHKNLRVRVSGFSDYFVNLNGALQDEVIARTWQS